MKRTIATVPAVVCILSTLSICLAQATTAPAPYLVPKAELLAELKATPRKHAERIARTTALLKQAGLTAVRTQSTPGDPSRGNVIATLPGETPEAILIGAHLDASGPNAGVIDDWSGVVMMTNLAQTLARQPKRRHTFVFIAFDLEERGLLGSEYFVTTLSLDRRRQIKAMVNLECLGVSGLNVWLTGSADSLEALAADVARTTAIPVNPRPLNGVSADSDSFMNAGIAAITFDSLARSDFHLIDSPNDRFEAINADTYARQYRYLVHYLRALDATTKPLSATNKHRAAAPVSLGFRPQPEAFRANTALVVAHVRPRSAEDRAGMKPGDRIVEFAGTVLNRPSDIMGPLRILTAGERIEVDVVRDGKTLTLTIQY